MSFLRKSIAFASVAFNARANHVFPGGGAATIARDHVIEIQVASVERISAILAGVFVAFEYIVPGKLHLLFRKPIEKQQHYDARDPDSPRNRRD